MILCIETSTDLCSIALVDNGMVVDHAENNELNSHSSVLSPMIEKMLIDHNIPARSLDAVAVGGGPGSYTGLRIGASTAKGICYAAAIPLIAVQTLNIVAEGIAQTYHLTGSEAVVPMLDARRMEVYCKVNNGNVEAKVIDENSFANLLAHQTVVFGGPGAEKCKKLITSPNAVFVDNIAAKAAYMAPEASHRLANQQFENVAYYEPFYLKEFQAAISKNKVLQ